MRKAMIWATTVFLIGCFCIPFLKSPEQKEIEAALSGYTATVESFSEIRKEKDDFGNTTLYRVLASDGREFNVLLRDGTFERLRQVK